MSKLRVLDLFSGIGGFSLGLEMTGGFDTIAFCEIDEWAQRVLRKHWPHTPIHSDIKTLTKDMINGPVDVICGGYPCQPFSNAGKRRGKADDRHLWPEMSRLIDEFRPRWVIGENVAGHVNMGLDEVLSDLESKGYTARAFLVPACAVDAPHRRYRTWVIAADADCDEQQRAGSWTGEGDRQARDDARRLRPHVADRFSAGLEGHTGDDDAHDQQGRVEAGSHRPVGESGLSRGEDTFWRWPAEPGVGRVSHGVSGRVDRLRGLGNAVVPQVVAQFGQAILDVEKTNDRI